MRFRCEDLAHAGVVLIPRDSAAFAPLLAEVKRAVLEPPAGSPPPIHDQEPALPDEENPASAILWNQSGKLLCAYTLIWNYRWQNAGEERTSHSTHMHGVGVTPSLLLPFGLKEERRAFTAYWQTILPHSRRYVADGCVLGSNADVRPPAPAEMWPGRGVFRWGGPRERPPEPSVYATTLTLDAVFFATGECAGPDSQQLWDQIIVSAQFHQEVAQTARQGLEAGLTADRIFAEIEGITGPTAQGHPVPPPPPPPGARATPEHHRERVRRQLAGGISHMRTGQGDEKALLMLSQWADADVPNYRRV